MLFEQNADVILSVAGEANLGVIEAAQTQSRDGGQHRWVIASGSDWSAQIPDHLRPYPLTSALKKWDVAVYEAIHSYVEGTFEPGIVILTGGDDAVGLAESTNLAPSVLEQAEAMTSPGDMATVPRTPSSELLAPNGLAVDMTITIVWNGASCSQDGAIAEYAPYNGLRIEFANESSDVREFWALHAKPESYDVPISTLVGPGSTVIGFIAPGPGTIELKCGPDLQAGAPRNPTTAAILTSS